MSRWSVRCLLVPFLLMNNCLHAVVEDEDHRAGCSTAVNDLVYIVDGSWSVGFTDFDRAKRWLVNISSSFDINSLYTQVGVVQYSDMTRLEIPLGKHQSRAELLKAIEDIPYLGGNTQTGRAIKFAIDHVFSSSQRSSRVKNRIAVVVTDGKSQDDVVDASVEARAQGITVFAVGVGSEITTSELVSIANKPASTYVLYAEDYGNIDRIREAMEQKLCEESVCPTRIPVASRDEKGFELLLGMNVQKKAQEIPGSLLSEAAYALSTSVDITENTRDIFPEGLPPSYVFVATLRLRGPSSKVPFDLWRVLSKDGEVQAAVTLRGGGGDGTVTFSTTTSSAARPHQTVVFSRGFKALFDGQWHQLRLVVRPQQVISFLDDQRIEEVTLETVAPIYINGQTQVAKRPGTDTSIAVDLQKLRLYCDPHQSERETACEIYSVDDERCPLNRTETVEEEECDCKTGPLGPPGPPGPMGLRGEKGQEGPPGPDGKPGKQGKSGEFGAPGSPGEKGELGPPGLRGESGLSGMKGERGESGLQGEPGPPGPRISARMNLGASVGMPGKKGASGVKGHTGPLGPVGATGKPGLPGAAGQVGPPGQKGHAGEPGLNGVDGPQGIPGIRGLPGEAGPRAPQGERGLPGQTGAPGPKGAMGMQGHPGPTGENGRDGIKGSSGDPGPAGAPGLPGQTGAQGQPGLPASPGAMGLPGFKGHKGDTGETGPNGHQGERGLDGDPGSPGTAGEVGPRGNKGEKGVVGEIGTKGSDGKQGDTGHFGVVGPRGSPGQDGEPGQPGQPGYPGKPGKPPSDEHLMKLCVEVLRNQLPALLQALAPPASCESCQTMKGPPGHTGTPGVKGSTGTPGYPGATGSQGYQGPPGERGTPGLKGDVGSRGLKGSKGESRPGPPGPSGQPGVQGPRGSDGHGHPGSPGTHGKSGAPGAPGKRGPSGPAGACDMSTCYQAYNSLREDRFSKGPQNF